MEVVTVAAPADADEVSGSKEEPRREAVELRTTSDVRSVVRMASAAGPAAAPAARDDVDGIVAKPPKPQLFQLKHPLVVIPTSGVRSRGTLACREKGQRPAHRAKGLNLGRPRDWSDVAPAFRAGVSLLDSPRVNGQGLSISIAVVLPRSTGWVSDTRANSKFTSDVAQDDLLTTEFDRPVGLFFPSPRMRLQAVRGPA